MNIKILIIAIFVSTTTLFAQNNIDQTSKTTENIYTYTVKVNGEIQEHDEYLLRNELQAASDILKYVDIKGKENLVIFIPYKKEVELYTPFLDKYFLDYKIYQSGKLIYTSKTN